MKSSVAQTSLSHDIMRCMLCMRGSLRASALRMQAAFTLCGIIQANVHVASNRIWVVAALLTSVLHRVLEPGQVCKPTKLR